MNLFTEVVASWSGELHSSLSFSIIFVLGAHYNICIVTVHNTRQAELAFKDLPSHVVSVQMTHQVTTESR